MTLSTRHIETIVDTILREVAEVKVIYLFGSLAEGRGQSFSDVDLALWGEEGLDALAKYHLQQDLAARINRDVDLIDMRTASLTLNNEIVQRGQLLYSDPEFDRPRFELGVISRFLDFQEATRDLREAIRQRGYVHG